VVIKDRNIEEMDFMAGSKFLTASKTDGVDTEVDAGNVRKEKVSGNELVEKSCIGFRANI
jgi:hypothetical protein